MNRHMHLYPNQLISERRDCFGWLCWDIRVSDVNS
jgi:hypothetical protein